MRNDLTTILAISGVLLGSLVGLGCDDAATCPDDAKCAADSSAPTDTLTAPDTVPNLPVDTFEVEPADETDASVAEDTASPLDTTPEVDVDTTPEVDVEMEVVAPAGTEVMSDKDAFRVWFDGPTSMRVGTNASFTVTLQDLAALPVEGLALAPSFIHTTMGHGGPKTPSASELGGGIYQVTNAVPSMAGKWRLEIKLPGSDKARLVVTVTN